MSDDPASVQNEPSGWIPAIRKKKATVLRHEIEDMVTQDGVNSVVTLTLSFAKFLGRAEAMKRWHSLSANLLLKRFKSWVWVIERAPKSGRLHFHVAAVLKGAQDVRTGFDFDAYDEWKVENQKASKANLGRKKALSRQFAKNATPDLRGLWHLMRPETMKKYGFGIAHIVPIKKNGEAFAFYMAKYLSKPTETVERYLIEDKGHRSYGVCGKRRVASIHHSPVTKRARAWRRRVEFTALVLGEVVLGRSFTHDELAKYCGPRWCYHFKPWMSDVPLSYIRNRARFGHSLVRNKLYDFPQMGKGLRAEDAMVSTFLDFYNGDGREIGEAFNAELRSEHLLKDGPPELPGTSIVAGAGLMKAGRVGVH